MTSISEPFAWLPFGAVFSGDSPAMFAINWAASAEALLSWLGLALFYGTLLALVTWALTSTVLRRARSGLHALLWLIVLVKFVLPVGPAANFSLASALDSMKSLRPAPAPVAPGPESCEVTGYFVPIEACQEPVGPVAPPPVPFDWGMVWLGVAGAYVTGALVVGALRLRSYARFRARCNALPPADGEVQRLVADVCGRLGLRRVPDVRIGAEAPAPFLFGALRPTLVLSPRQLSNTAELEAVVLHEIAHLRRGDLLVRYLQWFAGTLLFFWPVVAWVNRRIDLAREHACDEWALRHGRLSAGDYARTLLKAVQPVRSVGWKAYAPAAMAADRKHVERRIAMILDTPVRRRAAGWSGVGAALIAAGWGAFTLTGAAPARIRTDDAQAAQAKTVEGQRIVVTQSSTVVAGMPLDGSEGDFFIECAPMMIWCDENGAPPIECAGQAMFICTEESANGGEPERFEMQLVRSPAPAQLAEFLAAHPTADADGNGTLSPVEREAFLVARALSRPAAVLAQYPGADRNKNGALEADEAARLIQGGDLRNQLKPRIALDGDVAAAVQAADAAGEEKQVKRFRVLRLGATGDGEQQITLHATGPDGETALSAREIKLEVTRNGDGRSQPAFAWILESVAGEPAAREVARYVPVVEQTPLAVFLEMNPKADANRDGTLTREERDAYVGAQHAKMQQRLLERHPGADTNNDGTLSPEELHNWMRTNGPAGGEGVKRRILIGPPENAEDVVIQIDEEGC